jgi:hypothetical protein
MSGRSPMWGRRAQPNAVTHGPWPRTMAGLAAVVGLLVAIPTVLTAPASASSGWMLDHADNDPVPQGQLSSVSCPTPSWCMAVGLSHDAKGIPGPFAEAWNGTAWQHQPVPDPPGSTESALEAVSCPSPTQCRAVGEALESGGFVGFAESWAGSTWSVQTMPEPPGKVNTQVFGVSCPSPTACTAVGDVSTVKNVVSPLLERWNGTAWHVVRGATPPSGIGADLTGVSCTSAAVCTAVGAYNIQTSDDSAWAESSGGRGWTAEPVPTPTGAQASSLASVSCADATTCTGVGTSGDDHGNDVPEIAAWNGTTWTLQSAPDPGGNTSLVSVSCASPTDCSAVGTSGAEPGGPTFAEREDGTTWSVEAVPDPGPVRGRVYNLDGVSCPAATSCEAVGSVTAHRDTSFADGWDGTTWSLQKTPVPFGITSYRSLAGLSCVSARFCVAVGEAATPVQEWNGTGWVVFSTFKPLGRTKYTSVSCTSVTDCTVVGYRDGHRSVYPIAQRWNGTTWALETVPTGPDARLSTLLAVSCSSATSCTAVGAYQKHGYGSRSFTLAESWDGSTWTLRSSPTPAVRRVRATLSSVSCISSTACTAVGEFSSLAAGVEGLAEGWNGTTWSIQTTVNPSSNTELQGVSCASAVSCVAVGSSTTEGGSTVTLAEGWNGTTWAVQPTPNPTKEGASLGAVSCRAATACTAVGVSFTGSTSTTDALAWNGTSWSQQVTPTLPNNVQSVLNGLSCTAPATCTAVGSRQSSRSTQLNLVESEQG